MNRTHALRGPIAPVAALASALAMLVALTGPGLTPASADQFTPLEDPPSIVVQADNILVGDPVMDVTDPMVAQSGTDVDEYAAFEAFQPASPQSGEIYNVFATITTNGQLENVTEVRFCVYDSNDDRYATASNIDTDCGIPAALAPNDPLPAIVTEDNDPTRVLVIQWEAGGTPTITVVGDNNHLNAGTEFDLDGKTEAADGNTRSAKIRFSFKVSNAMQVSAGWKIRVAAESQATIGDGEGSIQGEQTSIDLPTNPLTVNYFAEMTTARESAINYGIVTPGLTILKEGDDSISTGAYTANGASVLTINGSDFVNDPGMGAPENTIALATNGDIFVPNDGRTDGDDEASRVAAIKNVLTGTVSLDCAFAPSIDLEVDDDLKKFVQVRNAARIFALGIAKTGEDATELADHSCMVNYPGGGPVANVVYSNSVTVAPIQSVGEPALGGGGGGDED
jgi:hypothetical protein